MIDFMILGLPRSGTTWASNFFTTDTTLCLHDPLYTTHYRDLDKIEAGSKRVGVACTGLWRFPEFVKPHPAKKLILQRSLIEVNASLDAIDLPLCTHDDWVALNELRGLTIAFQHLFDPAFASLACEYLEIPFDADRHAALVQIEMQPKFSGLKVGREVTRQLVDELQRAMK